MDKRYVIKLHEGFVDNTKHAFADLCEGDVFELYEADGELVGDSIWQAESSVYTVDGVATIKAIGYRHVDLQEK